MSENLMPPGFRKFAFVIDIVVKTGTILAVIFGFNQYLMARQDMRVNRSLSLVERFNSDTERAGKARALATKVWWDNRKQIERLVRSPADEFDKHRGNLVYKVLYMGGAKSEAIQYALIDLLDFFGELEVCVESRLCDEETAVDFFGPYADGYWLLYADEIEANRTMNNRLGFALRDFVKRIPQEERLVQ